MSAHEQDTLPVVDPADLLSENEIRLAIHALRKLELDNAKGYLERTVTLAELNDREASIEVVCAKLNRLLR
jgi:endonuclease/exonuclease/phosphatase family metal-dependent hydrolase